MFYMLYIFGKEFFFNVSWPTMISIRQNAVDSSLFSPQRVNHVKYQRTMLFDRRRVLSHLTSIFRNNGDLHVENESVDTRYTAELI